MFTKIRDETMPENTGYYRMPSLSSEKIVFVSENDLWTVPLTGGVANRLTTSLGAISYPKFSFDGQWIAFSSTDEGRSDVYVMPSSGGPIKRLTFIGGDNRVRGWTLDGEYIIFSTTAKTPGISRAVYLYKVHYKGGDAVEIPVGVALHINYHKNGFTVIGRFQDDNATWKRYKGGRAGDIIIDNVGNGEFKPLISLHGNLVLPQFYKDQVLFLSDHEGISNLYSINLDGSNLKKLTNHTDYYVRFFSISNDTVVYQSGGDIFSLNLSISQIQPNKLSITLPSMRTQSTRKFINPNDFLENFTIARNYSHLLTTVRGKIFHFGFWEGGVNQIGSNSGARYKLSVPVSDERIALFSDESGDYKIELYNAKNYTKIESFDFDIGFPYYSKASPDGKFIAVSNHRFELILINLVNKESKVIAKDKFRPFMYFDWSSDSQWISYSLVLESHLSSIFIFSITDNKAIQVTPTEFEDIKPVFDPKGRYLYFISAREFNSTNDSQYFRHIFPKGFRICAINLQNELDPPFILKPKILKSEDKDKKNTTEDNELPIKVKIDFEGIQRRITMLPLEESIYTNIDASEDRVFYSTRSVMTESELEQNFSNPINTLKAFKLDTLESVIVEQKISSFKLADDKKTLVLKIGQKIKIIYYNKEQKEGSGSNISDSDSGTYTRKSGFVNMERIKVLVDPTLEWKQMLNETWRLMRENYWEETIHGIDWTNVRTKYLKLVPKITTREEFSDLVWEMIAETGTSHCYEMGGDYRKSPDYKQGFLGATVKFNSSQNGYEIIKILRGDNWNIDISSPLDTPGANIKERDIITSINGVPASANKPIGEYLVNSGGQFVNLVIQDQKTKQLKEITVKSLLSELELHYRNWVNQNREYVSKASNNRVGYIHIPNMSNKGVTEFYRTFKQEITKEGLIVDVRFNRGGNTSQLFLEMLSSAQKRLGYDWTRHGKELEPYFTYTTEGPIVAVTNEFAGSDGDIFSHSFKMLKLGKLVGKRTWGGVVGIWPKTFLVDGSVVTQPEFSFWFKDVGWGVENYGTDPDVEVEFFPQDYAKNIDPQLDKSIEIALNELKKIKILKPTSPH